MLLNRSFAYPVLIATLILIAGSAVAQQEGGPPLLPDIDPQDIEIRGDFQVRFPGLSRQPILGFTPRPPIFRVDPDRMPFMETDEEIVAAIPISDLEPALKPEQNFITYSDQNRVLIRSGYGSYLSPEVKIIAETTLREDQSLALDFGHHSSDGDRDFSSFRNLGGDLQWTGQSGTHQWGMGLSAKSSFNYSPVALPGTGQSSFPMEAGRISHYSYGVEARWQYLTHAFRGWQSSLAINRFGSDGELLTGENAGVSETRYGFRLNRFMEGRQMEQVFGFSADATGALYNTMDNGTQYWMTNKLVARYRQLFGYAHQIQAWLRFYQLFDPVNEVDLYMYPDIYYQYQGSGRVSAGVRVRGLVKDPSMERLMGKNRFLLQHGRDLEHERGLHIGLQSEIEVGYGITYYTGADYWQYYNLGYYSLSDDAFSPYYAYNYTLEATHVEWYHGITHFFHTLRTTTTLELGLNFTGTDEEVIPTGVIPYVPRWTISAHFMSNPLDRLNISSWLDINGERKTETEGETLDGFFQLGMQADFRLHRNFGMYVKALNIFDQEFEIWQNYQERPFQVYGGLTLHW